MFVGHPGSRHRGSRQGLVELDDAEGIEDEALDVVVEEDDEEEELFEEEAFEDEEVDVDDDRGGAIELAIDAAKLARNGFEERSDGGKAPGGKEGIRAGSNNEDGGRYVPSGMSLAAPESTSNPERMIGLVSGLLLLLFLLGVVFGLLLSDLPVEDLGEAPLERRDSSSEGGLLLGLTLHAAGRLALGAIGTGRLMLLPVSVSVTLISAELERDRLSWSSSRRLVGVVDIPC